MMFARALEESFENSPISGIMSRPVICRLLIIDDDEEDRLLIEHAVADGSRGTQTRFVTTGVGSMHAALAVVRSEKPDIVLLDLLLPDSEGLEGLAVLRAEAPYIPIVIITGREDEFMALRAVREGAQDYLLKSEMFPVLLIRSLRHAIERNAAEKARVASESRYRQLVETANEGVWTISSHGVTEYVNDRMGLMLGYDPAEMLGRPAVDFVAPESVSDFQAAISHNAFSSLKDFALVAKDGTNVYALIAASPLSPFDGASGGVLAVVTDITDRREAEERLRARDEEFRQAQKMEAVGRLAGGVAHDFNNMLTVITSYTGIVMQTPGLDPSITEDLREVARAADRAATLTRQLLAFSRKQLAKMEALDLNQLLSSLERMLRPIIGEDVRLEFEFGKAGLVLGDHAQFEQAIVNLAINARDAMPAGGLLKLSTSTVSVPPGMAHMPEVVPGLYSLVTVSDTGQGIPPEVRSKIFDPFFTTKDIGVGTGLGLAMVYGVVSQSSGHIWCESDVGVGTSFHILLPQMEAAKEAEKPEQSRSAPARGNERILVVEDERALREVARRALVAKGYEVEVAANGEEALEIVRTSRTGFDVFITDLVMPGMSGPEFISTALQLQPQAKVIYMSGYSSQETWRDALRERHDGFIEKPFGTQALADAVRAAFQQDGS